MPARGRSAQQVGLLGELKRSSASGGFNLKLLSDMFMLSHMYSFVTLALARDNAASIIGWMSDRDKMTFAFDSVLWPIAFENVHGLAEHFQIILPAGGPNISVPTPTGEALGGGIGAKPGASIMWFDEFIRIPDYIAGVLSAWDFPVNGLPVGQPKYLDLVENVMAKADNTVVLRVTYTDEFQTARMVFEKIEDEASP